MFLGPLALNDDEAMQLAEATLNLQREFDIVISPKLEAALALGGVAMGIYGPKLMTARALAMQRRRAAAEAADPMHFTGAPRQPWEQPDAPGAAADDLDPFVTNGDEVNIVTGMPDGGRVRLQ